MIILSPDENEKTSSDKQVKPVSNPPPPPPPPEKYEFLPFSAGPDKQKDTDKKK